MGGRLVEHDDRRVLQQQPGDRQALLLAAGQAVAAIADDGVETVGQLRDEVPDLRGTQRLDEFVVGGVGLGVEQVGPQGVVEQVGVLGDHADRARAPTAA